MTSKEFDKRLDEILDIVQAAKTFDEDSGREQLATTGHAQAKQSLRQLFASTIGDDEGLITPEKYAELHPSRSMRADAATHYENKARFARNQLRAELRSIINGNARKES